MKRVLLMMLACVMLIGAAHAQWNLFVTVKNKSGELLSGATVIIQGTYWQTATDPNGNAQFTKLPRGTYVVRVSHLGYKEVDQNIDLTSNQSITVELEIMSIVTEEVVIKGVRAENTQPATFTVMQKKDLDARNLGQDIPYMLSMEPSVVTTSDGGTGIGYTSMRIRGLDNQKINVTINGIPYNDAESHGAYWVDIPDIASSVRSIQIQRGLGKSANGPTSFGASLNIETNQIPLKPYVVTDNSFGSYKTMKNTVQAGTGLINNHWFAEGRFSNIGSDGYIDRASSKLRSYFGQTGYYSNKTIVRLIAFGGREETYQAWWGIDSASIQSLGRTYNWAGYYYKNGQDNFYNKQVDHYNQDHIQLNISHSFTKSLTFNTVLNYTYGRGYYQEYYSGAAFQDYNLNSLIVNGIAVDTSDLVGRKWLKNNLLAGNTFLSWNLNKVNLTYGIGFADYFNARHFGEIIWSDIPNTEANGHEFYRNTGNKVDISTYLKLNYKYATNGNLYLDMNYRYINYKLSGIDKENGDELQLDLNKSYNFLNPIFGISYSFPKVGVAYATFGVSNREPTRSDFINNYSRGIKPETMYNSEIGLRRRLSNAFYEINFYTMLYRNELIKTGQLDDVGYPIQRNAGKSYRYGVELNAGAQLTSYLTLKGNIALSRNRTDFKDYIDNAWIIRNDVTISYSPSVVAAGEVLVQPFKFMQFSFANKYVGKQYLDNTENNSRSLKEYFVSNLGLNIKQQVPFLKRIEFKALVNNLFNVKYNSNGAVYGSTPYYYPQATRNFLIGISLEF